MNKTQTLMSIAVVSFVAGAGLTVVQRHNYRESNLARLRADTDLIEIKDGVFCMKSFVDELSTEQLLGDGFCNTHFSRLSSWL